MEKYLGLVRENWESMSGVSITYLTKVSSEKSELEEWFDSFQDSENEEYDKIIIPNFPELEQFFEQYIVPDPTDEEKEECRLLLALTTDEIG